MKRSDNRLQVRLADELRDHLERLARKEQRTLSQMVRVLILESLARRKRNGRG